MRRIKIMPEVGSPMTFEPIENNLSVGELIVKCGEKGFSLDIKSTSLRDKASRETFTTPDAILPDGDITLFTLPKDPKGNI